MRPWLLEYQARAKRQGNHIAHYLPILFGTVARYPYARVCELGTDRGDSTVALLAAAELTGGHVWSVDINPECEFIRECEPWHYGGFTFICGDSTDQATADQVPGTVDVLFIDSSHLYEETKREIDLYLPKVRPGGVMLLHDTNKPGTADRVREALEDRLSFLPLLSWYEHPGANGLGVVEVPR